MAHIHLGEGSFPLWALVLWTTLGVALVGVVVYRVRKGGIKTHQIALAGIGAAASFAIFQLNLPVWGGIHMNLTGLVGVLAGPLLGAPLDNYRAGHEFADLHLIVDDAEEIVPHRTVYAGDRFALRIDENADGQPWVRLGSRPWRSWASAWKRLTAHPLDLNHDKHDMLLDANLRRIGSWSTALQYIEDLETRRENS